MFGKTPELVVMTGTATSRSFVLRAPEFTEGAMKTRTFPFASALVTAALVLVVVGYPWFSNRLRIA
jgi:hypothetical protein